jgi:hypothetical protein
VFKLDNDFLVSLGLGSLPVDEKNKLLQAIYERLEMNVGMRLAEKMSDSQLDEFEGFIDRNDESGALRWLESNFPNYKDVVAEELDKLKQEVSAAAPQIMSAAQAPAVPQGPPPQQFQPPQPQSPYEASQQVQPPQQQPQFAPQPTQQPFNPPQQPYQQPDYPTEQPPSTQPPAGY